MGPRKGDDEVLGRYAIHFHADNDGSRGSLVDGVAVYDSTGHGFASHLSNGVTFRDCIAHDMVDDAFWWDLSLDGGGRDLVPSHDIVYERCVASFVKSGGNSRFNLTGFLMGAGNGNIARGCVATGRGGRRRVIGRLQLAVAVARRQHLDVRGQHGPQRPPQRHLLLAERQAPHARRRFHGLPLRSGHLRRLVRQPRLVPRLHHLRVQERRGGDLGVAGQGGQATPATRSRTRTCTSTRRV